MSCDETKYVYSLIQGFSSSSRADINNSIANIMMIFRSLGIKRIFNELIPFLCNTPSLTENNWCKILTAIKKINFSRLSDQEMIDFISTFKSICISESKLIKGKLVELLSDVVSTISSDKTHNIILPFIWDQIESSWIPEQGYGITFLSVIASYIDKKEFNSILESKLVLINADSINIQRNFIEMLSNTINYIEKPTMEKIFSLIERKADENSSYIIAKAIVEFLIAYVESSKDSETVISIGDGLLHNENPAIRKIYVSNISKLTKTFSSAVECIYREVELESDPDIIESAVKELQYFNQIENMDLFKEKFEKFIRNQESIVMEATIRSLCAQSEKLGIEFVSKLILSIFDDDDQLVKLAAIKSLQNSGIPADQILNTIVDGFVSLGWREKVSVAELLPNLIEEDIPQRLLPVFFMLLCDESAAVRNAAVQSSNIIVKIIDDKLFDVLLTQIPKLAKHPDYQVRQTVAHMIIVAGLIDKCSQTIEELAKDPVANVRLIIAKYAPYQIRKALKNDADEDVRDAANDI